MIEPLIPELDVPILFRRRPVALPGDLRPAWRISLVLVLLRRCCTGGKSSLRRLHVLSWAIRFPHVTTSLLHALGGNVPPDAVIIRIEPALNRAVDFAIGEGLVRRGSKDRIELTNSGKEFADEILSDQLVLGHEKQFVELVRFNVTESFVNAMFDRGKSP